MKESRRGNGRPAGDEKLAPVLAPLCSNPSPDDPDIRSSSALCIETWVHKYTREHGYIVETEAVVEIVKSQMAYTEQESGGGLGLEKETLDGIMRDAIRHQLAMEVQELRSGHEGRPEESERDKFLVEGIGVRPVHARLVGARYNGLPGKVRRAFFAVAVANKKMATVASESGGEWKTGAEVRTDVLLALTTLMGLEPDGLESGRK